MSDDAESVRMTGAESLLRTASGCGVRCCFANPGTSEMHFLAALGSVPEITPILGLFEGVVTGMADGYARISGRPALTLLHLGTGLSNGIANLHNARRAHSPVINVVGEHASYHNVWDSPLKTDIPAIAKPVSDWLRVCDSAHSVSADMAMAYAAATDPPGGVATLILPADAAWNTTAHVATPPPPSRPAVVDLHAVDRAAAILKERGPRTIILVSATVGKVAGLRALERICSRTGARPMAELVAAKGLCGGGLFPVPRVPYRAEDAVAAFSGIEELLLVGTPPPIAPFAYPKFPSECVPGHVNVTWLSLPHENEVLALETLAHQLGAPHLPERRNFRGRRAAPSGPLTAASIGRSIARHLPEDAIVSEEAISNAGPILAELAAAPRYVHLPLTGGAIGQGMPVATGAAVAGGGRKVLNIQADGSAMYTFQALWTQARERLDVVTVILANRSYGILKAEVERVDAAIGSLRAAALLEIGDPDIDFVALANGLGVEASRATSAAAFDDQLEGAMRTCGPRLIEAVLE